MNKRKLTDVSNSVVYESNTFKIKKIGTDPINYMAVPSLESIALANIVVKLWEHTDYRKVTLNDNLTLIFLNYPHKKGFDEMSKIISQKVPLLPLPNILKYKAKTIIKPIGLEIVHWIKRFESYYWQCNFTMEHFRSFYWTMKGTIDTAKTFEKLYFDNEEKQHIFNKACEYCLEDRISSLFRQMPRETQENYFYCKEIYLRYPYHLIAYWVCFIRNELPKLLNLIRGNDFSNIYNPNNSIYQNMFRLSLFECRLLAVKYFWNKLPDEERNNNKVSWTCLVLQTKKHNPYHHHNNDFAEIMCFLLSQLNDKEQIEVFQKYSEVILNCLYFCWPWQPFFLPTVQLMWNYLDNEVYIKLLSDAIVHIDENKPNGLLLKDLWCNSPMKFKKHFIQNIIDTYGSDLLHLFEIGDSATIKLIFKDADVKEKKQIIFSTIKSGKLLNILCKDKLFFLQILIRESMMSEFEITNIKGDILLKHGDAVCSYCVCNDNWKTAENFLDWCLISEDQVATFKAKILNKIKVENSLGMLSAGKWSSFESFINWIFNSAEEINQFKFDVLSYDKMQSFIFDIIIHGFNFEFANQFLVWYFPSGTEIDQFKKELMLSKVGIDMFHSALSDYGYLRDGYGHWRLIEYKVEERRLKFDRWKSMEKLIRWFHPFKKEVLIEFKEKFKENSLRYEGFYNRFNKDGLIRLFFLLDNFIPGFNGNRDIIVVVDKMLDAVNNVFSEITLPFLE